MQGAMGNGSAEQRIAALEKENATLREQLDILRANEQRFTAFMEHLPGAAFINREGCVVYANKWYFDQLGWQPEDILNRPCEEYLPPEVYTYFITQDQEVLAKQSALTAEDWMETPEGQKVYLTTKFPIPKLDGSYDVGGFTLDISARKQAEQDLVVFKLLAENSPIGIAVANLQGCITYANPACGMLFATDQSLVGEAFPKLFPDDVRDTVQTALQETMVRSTWQGVLSWQSASDTRVVLQTTIYLIQDDREHPVALVAMVSDITQQQRAEEERQQLQQQVINAQRAAIRELSTPLIPLTSNVVLMPLVGTVDSLRAQQVMEVLLEGIVEHQATVAIVDITGITVVDTQVANALLRAAQAVRLLGAQVILTGIGPTIAQTLVHLGADLSTISTRGSLQSAIYEALEAASIQE